jgi:hypothetical protein
MIRIYMPYFALLFLHIRPKLVCFMAVLVTSLQFY